MATKVSEDVSEVWIEYKKDQTNQELRNRLMELSAAGQIQRGKGVVKTP